MNDIKQKTSEWIQSHRRWGILLFIVLFFAWGSYLRFIEERPWADWTGFKTKTLWEWMELFIVPAALAIGAYWLENSERKREQITSGKRAQIDRELALDHQRASALQMYIDGISELILEKGLQGDSPEEKVRNVARIYTLAALQVLDGKRKSILLSFLYETGLINKEAVIKLIKADLSEITFTVDATLIDNPAYDKEIIGGKIIHELICKHNFNGINLQETDLSRADLSRLILTNAQLSKSNLTKSDLSGTWLSNTELASAILIKTNLEEARLDRAILSRTLLGGTNLRKADLSQASLEGALIIPLSLKGQKRTITDFTEANLSGVSFHNATLSKVDLTNANICKANFSEAKLENVILKGAKYDNETIWPDGFLIPDDATKSG